MFSTKERKSGHASQLQFVLRFHQINMSEWEETHSDMEEAVFVSKHSSTCKHMPTAHRKTPGGWKPDNSCCEASVLNVESTMKMTGQNVNI